jgi:hypothetical protein
MPAGCGKANEGLYAVLRAVIYCRRGRVSRWHIPASTQFGLGVQA